GHVTQRFCAADGVVQIENHEDAVFWSRSEITTRYKVQQDTLSEFSVNLSHENDYGHERQAVEYDQYEILFHQEVTECLRGHRLCQGVIPLARPRYENDREYIEGDYGCVQQ